MPLGILYSDCRITTTKKKKQRKLLKKAKEKAHFISTETRKELCQPSSENFKQERVE